MTTRSAQHDTFTLRRHYPASPERVYRAWSNADAKAAWFGAPAGWTQTERTFNFEVGGQDTLIGTWAEGGSSAYRARYLDIVPGERVIYTYAMDLDGVRISHSLATVEVRPGANGGTDLTYTEQAVYVDGYEDKGSREHGTGMLLERLGASLVVPV